MTSSQLKLSHKKPKIVFPEFCLKLERGVRQNCELCKTSYNVFKKQHICKRCLRSVCADCSPFKVKTYLANRNIRLHRNCTACNVQSGKIQQYIQENKLNFGKDSDLLYIWSKAMTDRKGIKVSRSKSNTNNYIDLDNLWSSFNFSFRQFIGRLIQKNNVSDADLINLINNGLEEIGSSFADNIQDGTYIYLFFLCHSDLETAVNLTLYLLDLLQKTKNTKELVKKLIQNVGFSEIEMYKIEEFLSDNELIFKDSATANILPVTATFQIVNSTIVNKNLHFLWRGIMLLLFERKEVVFKYLYKVNIIIIDLLRNPNVNFKSLKIVPDAISSEYDAKLTNLMKDFEVLKNKNERLEKQLHEKGGQKDKVMKDKVLTDSLFSDDSIGSSNKAKKEESTNAYMHFRPQEFSQILQGKNEEIIRLKMKNQEFQLKNKEKTQQALQLYFQNQVLKEQVTQKDSKILKLQQQNKGLRNTNLLLIQKMKELSKLLMDQQQKEIHQNQEVLEQIKHNYQQLAAEQKKEECNIY